jgi:hypothetical protein
MAADSKLVVMLKLDGTELGKGISRAQADIAKIGVAFSGIGAAAGAAIKFAADFQDQTIKNARAAGVASQAYSELAYAAKLSGVSNEELTKSLVKLQNPVGLVGQTFKDLGIQTKDISGKFKSQSALMSELAEKFKFIQDPALKSQAALRIFGEEGVKMVSMLEAGTAGLRSAAKEAYEFGQTVSEKAGKNAEAFNDNLTKVTMGLTGFRNVVAESAIATINQSGALESAQNVLKNAIAFWRGLSDETKSFVLKAVAVVAGIGALALALSAVAAILPQVAVGFKLMLGPVGLVLTALTALIGGFSDYSDLLKKSPQDAEKWAAAGGITTMTIAAITQAYQALNTELAFTNNVLGGTFKNVQKAALAYSQAAAAKKQYAASHFKLTPTEAKPPLPPEILYKSDLISAITQVDKVKLQSRALGAGGAEGRLKEIEAEDKKIRDLERSYASEGQQVAIQYGKISEAAANLASSVIKPFAGLTDAIAAGIQYTSEVALRDLDVTSNRAAEAYTATRAAMESEETAKIKALEDSYDKQIEAVRAGESAKNMAIEFAANERLLAADEEYKKQMDALNASYAAQAAADQADYEAKMAILDSRAIDREQRQLTESIMENDQKTLAEQREKDHEAALAALAKEYADKQKGIDVELKANLAANASSNKDLLEQLAKDKGDALTAAEADKNAKLKALDEARAAEEKAMEKKKLETQYNAQMDAFHATKAVKIAETIASGVASAAQAFAALAPIPFVGIALGAAAAGVISAAMAMRVGQIASQEPIKPAGLLREGGLIGGSTTHEQGGIPANVESGEMFIDKGRSAKMLNAIDNGIAGGGGITVNIMAGAIQGDVRDEGTIKRLADLLGRQISRRMVAT